jgi:hypothetical protein
MAKKPRNYKKEYKKFQSSTKSKKDRASRNKARAQAIKSGRAKKGDGKDIAHLDNNPRNNRKGNTKTQSKTKNRGHGLTAPGRKKGSKRKKK